MAANKRSKDQQPTYHKMHIKTGDTVQVISGKAKHVKPKQEGESGRIVTAEFPIHSSNVMHYSSKQEIASRICYTFTESGKKVRMLKKTGEIIDR